jgi:hypothetical protein
MAKNKKRAPKKPPKKPRTPRWDARNCILWWGKLVVKEFKRPASNQEQLFAAFQQVEWQHEIWDPLPRDGSLPPKRRLHDTVMTANRHQENPKVRFRLCHRGRAVRWEPIDDD